MNVKIMTIVVAFLSSINLLSQETKLIENKFYDSKQIQDRYSVLKSNKQIKHGGGTVGYSYKINKDCSVSIKITKSFNEEFDNYVIAVLKRKSELQMRYGLSCDEKELSQDIVFRLD